MAKATQQTKSKAPTPSREVATRGASKQEVANSEDLAALDEMMAADAGKGVSTAMEDNTVPLIYILQALSPQVNKKKEEYVPGAEAGMIWFRGTKRVVKGDEGILAVPCHMEKSWVEWKPNRGGFVEKHKVRPADAVEVTDPQNGKKFWQRKNGNTVVETREHAVIILDDNGPSAYVIPMSGSNHKASKDWMTLQNQKRVPNREDLKAPAYGYLYRMCLSFQSNDKGDWYMWSITDENDVPTRVTDPEVYKMARQIQADFESGAKKAQVADDQVDDSEVGGEGGGGAASRQRASEVL